HTWKRANRVLSLRLEAIPHRAGGRGQLEGEAYAARRIYGQILDHTQAHDVATEVRVVDLREHVEHLLVGGRRHRMACYGELDRSNPSRIRRPPGRLPAVHGMRRPGHHRRGEDRKSTRLNSSHDQISYAVFCLKKKTN